MADNITVGKCYRIGEKGLPGLPSVAGKMARVKRIFTANFASGARTDVHVILLDELNGKEEEPRTYLADPTDLEEE